MVCFNPCFYGTTSSTLPSAVNTRRQAEFQSLFLWNDLFNKNPVFSNPTVTGSFNPCFYGTTSSTRLLMTRKRLSPDCFNPCFYGTTSSTIIIIDIVLPLKGFQSLFL